MFWNKKKDEKKAPVLPSCYPSGAVAYNGGNEVYSICIALVFALQTYDQAKKLAPKKAAQIYPFVDLWTKCLEKNAAYIEKIQGIL